MSNSKRNNGYSVFLIIFGSIFCVSEIGFADETNEAAVDDPDSAEVDSIKEKYWARGDESQMGVVQNRTYTKARKFHLGAAVNFLSSDPFLTVRGLQGELGYFFNETWGLSVVGSLYQTEGSSALDSFEKYRDATANTNEYKAWVGVEGVSSLLYGKLSLLGWKILYYDLHLSANAGVAMMETGNAFAYGAGIGQRFYINQWCSFRVDYRFYTFQERIVEKEILRLLGTEIGTRQNFSHSFNVGVDLFVDLFGG